MNRINLVSCAWRYALCALLSAEAQQPTKVPRIGYLTAVSPSAVSARIEAFRQGLRELGYVEGKNIVIECAICGGKTRSPPRACGRAGASQGRRHRHGRSDYRPVPPRKQPLRFPLSWRRMPILLAAGSSPALRDRVGTSLDCQLLRPELSGKRLELLKEIVPKLSRVAVLGTSTQPGNAQALKEMELAAGAFGVKLQYLDVLDPKDIETAFRAASKGRADAVLVLVPSRVASSHRTQIAELAVKSRLPAIYPQSQNLWKPAGL